MEKGLLLATAKGNNKKYKNSWKRCGSLMNLRLHLTAVTIDMVIIYVLRNYHVTNFQQVAFRGDPQNHTSEATPL